MRSANVNASRRPRSTRTSWAVVATRGSMRSSLARWRARRPCGYGRTRRAPLPPPRRPAGAPARPGRRERRRRAGARGPDPVPAPVDVRVMTFNIWLGGDVVDFGKVIDAITAARADVVGLQE